MMPHEATPVRDHPDGDGPDIRSDLAAVRAAHQAMLEAKRDAKYTKEAWDAHDRALRAYAAYHGRIAEYTPLEAVPERDGTVREYDSWIGGVSFRESEAGRPQWGDKARRSDKLRTGMYPTLDEKLAKRASRTRQNLIAVGHEREKNIDWPSFNRALFDRIAAENQPLLERNRAALPTPTEQEELADHATRLAKLRDSLSEAEASLAECEENSPDQEHWNKVCARIKQRIHAMQSVYSIASEPNEDVFLDRSGETPPDSRERIHTVQDEYLSQYPLFNQDIPFGVLAGVDPREASDEERKAISRLDALAVPLQHDSIVFRGESKRHLDFHRRKSSEGEPIGNQSRDWSQLQPGEIFQTGPYTFCSTVPGHAMGYAGDKEEDEGALIIIRLPSGTPVVYGKGYEAECNLPNTYLQVLSNRVQNVQTHGVYSRLAKARRVIEVQAVRPPEGAETGQDDARADGSPGTDDSSQFAVNPPMSAGGALPALMPQRRQFASRADFNQRVAARHQTNDGEGSKAGFWQAIPQRLGNIVSAMPRRSSRRNQNVVHFQR